MFDNWWGDSNKVIKDSGFADDVSFISTWKFTKNFWHNETTTIK